MVSHLGQFLALRYTVSIRSSPLPQNQDMLERRSTRDVVAIPAAKEVFNYHSSILHLFWLRSEDEQISCKRHFGEGTAVSSFKNVRSGWINLSESESGLVRDSMPDLIGNSS